MSGPEKHYWVAIDDAWHRAWFDNIDTDCGLPITDQHYETHSDHPGDPVCSKCAAELKHHAIDPPTMVRSLAWCDLPLHTLSEDQIATIYAYVEREIDRTNRARTPGVHFVMKERRRGRTNRQGWRWVAYVGDTVDSAAEISVCTTLRMARAVARREHAVYFADFAQRALATAASTNASVPAEHLPEFDRQIWDATLGQIEIEDPE